MTETKGRPTPKRSDARAAKKKPLVGSTSTRTRGRTPPADAKGRRAANASVRSSMRDAMKNGDERNYPRIAAGPERAAVRDVVDGRRSFGWLAIPGWFLGMALTVIPLAATKAAGSVVFPLLIGIVLSDGLSTSRAVRRDLDARWPDGTKERRRALVFYGIARNLQFRRQRLPRPRVWRGQDVTGTS